MLHGFSRPSRTAMSRPGSVAERWSSICWRETEGRAAGAGTTTSEAVFRNEVTPVAAARVRVTTTFFDVAPAT